MHWIVGLDLSEMDPLLIRYLNTLEQIRKPEKICFLHTIKLYELTENMQKRIRHEDIRSAIKKHIKELVAKEYKGPAEVDIQVEKNLYTEQVFEQMAEKQSRGLVICGHKQHYTGSGALNQKLARVLRVPLLLVPESYHQKLERVLIPVDFSKYSQHALESSCRLDGTDRIETRTPLHVLKIPPHYFPYLNRGQISRETEREVIKRYDKFLRKTGTCKGLESLVIRQAKERTIAQHIIEHTIAGQYDLITLGAKGRNAMTSLFIGGVANEMILSDITAPLLLVKNTLLL